MNSRLALLVLLSLNLAVGSGAPNSQSIRQWKAGDKAISRFLNLGGSSSTSTADSEISLGALNTLFGGESSTSTFSIQNASYVTLGIVVLIPLTIGLALLFYLIGGAGDGLSALRRTDFEMTARNSHVSFNPYSIDWESFSILDWLSIAEETWSKFEPGNLDCQKRLVCEIHQNAPKFGYIAKKMVDAFSYLEYAQVLRLPVELKNIVEDYLDAADRGRTLKKDCGEVYSGCDFSVKKLLDKVSHNEV